MLSFFTKIFLQELAMLEYSMLDLTPSEVACGAVALAAATFNDTRSLRALPILVPGAATSTVPCMHRLLAIQRAAAAEPVEDAMAGNAPYLPVKDKFSEPRWCAVAHTPPCTRLATML